MAHYSCFAASLMLIGIVVAAETQRAPQPLHQQRSTDAPLAPTSEHGGWSFRIKGGLKEKEGLLEVLPPHESEWGTVCGDTSHMNELIRAGLAPSMALAAFFNPVNALVACRSAGFNTSRAHAFHLDARDGWGNGPTYMSHVDCASHAKTQQPHQSVNDLPNSLAECYFALSLSSILQGDCNRGDDVYINCDGGNGETMGSPEGDAAAASDWGVVAANHERLARQFQSLQDDASVPIPNSVVIVASSSMSRSTLATTIANIVSDDPSRVNIVVAGNKSLYAYHNVSFVNVSASTPEASSITGVTTSAPSSRHPSALMSMFISAPSLFLASRGIFELRIDGRTDYGNIDGGDTAKLTFFLQPPGDTEFMGNATSTAAGYLKATTIGNKIGGNVCNITASTRFITASYICGSLEMNTIPSLLIPHFGGLNSGMITFANLRILQPGLYAKTTSQYYDKVNNCNNADTYGIICGAGSFQDDGYSQMRFCVSTRSTFKLFTSAVLQELHIPEYRFRLDSSNADTFCFHIGYGYPFKDNSSFVSFDVFDLQFIMGSLNELGWKLLTAERLSSIAPIETIPYEPVQPVILKFTAMSNYTGEYLKQQFVDELLLDNEDVIVLSDVLLPGILPRKPTEAPTPVPTPAPTPAPTPSPTRKKLNRKNKTRTVSEEITISAEVTASVEVTLTAELNNATTAPPTTPAPTPIPQAEEIREVTIQFMFESPAFEAYRRVEAKELFAWQVFAAAPPNVVTPAPPPPDQTPLITGLAFAGLFLLIFLIIGAIAVKKIFYTRTARRWDDDYVMMNTQVLTVPLNEFDSERTPSRRNKASAIDTGDRDTAELI